MTFPLEIAFRIKPSARDRSEKHRLGTHFQGMIHEKPDIILICTERSGITGGIRLLGIIMTELDEEVFPSLEVILHPVPDAERLHAFGAAAVLGIIRHKDIAVHMGLEPLSPASFRIFIGKILVCHGRVSHQAEDNLVLSGH